MSATLTPEQTAAYYNYDADRLYFEYNRRAAGSFTTTLDGSREERDRYWSAWKIANKRSYDVQP